MTHVYVVGIDVIGAGVCKQRVKLDSMAIICNAQKKDLAFIHTKADLRLSNEMKVTVWRERDRTCNKRSPT